MDWEEIVLEGIKPGSDFFKSLSRAAEIAPPRIRKILEDFPASINYSKEDVENLKRNRQGVILLLLYYHSLSMRAERFEEFPLDEQVNVLRNGVKSSNAVAKLAFILHEKEIEARYLSLTGGFLSDLGKLLSAVKLYDKSAEKYKELAQKNPEYSYYVALCLNNIGTIHIYGGKFPQAENEYIEALRILRSLSEKNSESYASVIAIILNNLGNIYTDINNYLEGEKAQKEALKIRRALSEKDPETYLPYVAKSLSNLGTLYLKNYNLSQAEEMFKENLTIRKTLAEKNPAIHNYYVAETLINLGDLCIKTDRFAEAERAYNKALRITREQPKEHSNEYDRNSVWALAGLAYLYCITDRFAEAERAYNKALRITREQPKEYTSSNLADMATILEYLGVFYSHTNQFLKAEKAQKEASEIIEYLLKRNPEVYTHYFLENLFTSGRFYYGIKKLSESEKLYNNALKIGRKLAEKNPRVYDIIIARILERMGMLYKNTNRFLRAERAYTEALTILRKLVEKNPEVYSYEVACVLDSMGMLYVNTNNYSKAENAFKEAIEIKRRLLEKNPNAYGLGAADTLEYLGNLYRDIDKYSQAEQVYKEALRKFRELEKRNPGVYSSHVATTLNKLGALYNITGEYSKAEKACVEALKITRELVQINPDVYGRDVAVTLGTLANTYKDTDRVFQTERTYTEALTILRELAKKNPEAYYPDIVVTLHNLGSFYRNTGRDKETQKIFAEALRITEDRGLWLEMPRIYYNLSFSFPDKIETAVQMLELSILFSGEEKYKYTQKGRDEVIYLKFLKHSHDPHRMFGTLEALRDPDLLSLQWDLEGIQKARDNKNLQKKMVKNLPQEIRPLNVPFCIPEDFLFLYMQKINRSVLYITIANNEIKKFRSTLKIADFGEKLLMNLRMQVLAALHNKELSDIMATFDDLSTEWVYTLPQGIQELMHEKGTIIFSPDASFSYFPLEGFLINSVPICLSKRVIRATSMHQLQEIALRRLVVNSSLVVGNPWPLTNEKSLTYNHPDKVGPLKYLQNAEKEAEILARYLPNAECLLNTDATADAFLTELSRHSIIHFAGHGSLGRVLFFSRKMTRIPPEFEPDEFSRLRKAWRVTKEKTIHMMEEWDIVTDLNINEIHLQKGALIFLNACETGKHAYAGGGHFQGLAQSFLKSGASNVISSLISLYDKPSRDFALSFYELLSQRSVSTALQNTRRLMKEKYRAHIYWLPYIHYGFPFDPDLTL